MKIVYALIAGFLLSFVLAAAGYLAGGWLDSRWGTSPEWLLKGTVLGTLVGTLSLLCFAILAGRQPLTNQK